LKVYLVDGTYELFRHFYAVPRRADAGGMEVGAIRGVLASVLALVRDGATHFGVATDHVIESFRNELWPHYKRGDGIDPELLVQFHPLEESLEAMGVTVWPMREYEADDALASVAATVTVDPRVEQVLICTPDKDLAQCVVGTRVVQLDRRAREIRDADAIRARYGVDPASIPDYLALVGDSSDGFPGIPGWGAKSAAAVLGHYRYLERIPRDPAAWEIPVRGAVRLATALSEGWERAILFRDLATLRTDAVKVESADELRWQGPGAAFEALCARMDAPDLLAQARQLVARGRPGT
jgi:5'-3' exonuclease